MWREVCVGMIRFLPYFLHLDCWQLKIWYLWYSEDVYQDERYFISKQQQKCGTIKHNDTLLSVRLSFSLAIELLCVYSFPKLHEMYNIAQWLTNPSPENWLWWHIYFSGWAQHHSFGCRCHVSDPRCMVQRIFFCHSQWPVLD